MRSSHQPIMPDHHSPLPTTPIAPTPHESDLLRVLRDVRYGQVVVQVHNGRVVQIERTERFRSDSRTVSRERGT